MFASAILGKLSSDSTFSSSTVLVHNPFVLFLCRLPLPEWKEAVPKLNRT